MSLVTWPPHSLRDRVHPDQQPIRMCRWIAQELTWGINHGWKQGYPVTSGYRPGPDSHTSTGLSNHQAEDYNNGVTPCGAVDFGGYDNPAGYETKKALIDLAERLDYKGHRLMMPAGFHDDGHCSGNGH